MACYSLQELGEAWDRVRRHPVSGRGRETAVGVDGMRADAFERNRAQHLAEMARMVRRTGPDGLPAYRFGPLLCMEKPKLSGGMRRIYIPRLRDQVVFRLMHEELVRAAAQAGRDLRPAPPRRVVQRFRADLAGAGFVVRADIRGFFDSVPRDRVVAKALELPLDSLTAGLLRAWSREVRAREPWCAGRESDRPVDGLPQGLSLSGTLAELWVLPLDEAAAGRWPLFRYIDDLAIPCPNVRVAEEALDWLVARLAELGLGLAAAKTRISSVSEGVPWLGLVHYPDRAVPEEGRPQRWLRRFAVLRRRAAASLLDPGASSEQVLRQFHRAIREEISGRSSSRPGWYAGVEDGGAWRRLDRSLHAMIRSLHRQAGAPPPRGRQLPSIHRALRARRQRQHPDSSAPSNADQGPCATLPAPRGPHADPGPTAPDGAEPFTPAPPHA
jgi:hypothetical protein